MSRGRILLSGVLLVLLLGLLAAGMRGLAFRSGQLGGLPVPTDFGTGELRFSHRWAEILLQVWVWLFVGVALVGVVVSLFDARLRRKLLFGTAGTLLCIIVFMGVMSALVGEEPVEPVHPEEAWSGAWGPVMPPAGLSEAGAVRADPPRWLLYVAAGAGAMLLMAVGWWVVGKVRVRLRENDAQTELMETVARAANELRGGLPVDEVVIRCWARMAELMAPRLGPAAAPTVTPREMAVALRGHGVRDRAVGELTALFEEVRYGHKDALSRRERALSALSAVEAAYGRR